MALAFISAKTEHASASGIPVLTFEIRDSAFFIGNTKFAKADLGLMKKVLGKPERSIKWKHKVEMRRWEANADGSKGPCHFYEIDVTDYFYLFDKAGVVLFTNNIHSDSPEPTEMIINLGKKRTFKNIEEPEHLSKNTFKGIFLINGDTLHVDRSPIPVNVNYNNDKFPLFKVQCSPTSYMTKIDRIYSYDPKSYFMLFLSDEKEQLPSYIKVF
jgi:hypothetical protein